jgi:hypothetical protein
LESTLSKIGRWHLLARLPMTAEKIPRFARDDTLLRMTHTPG